MDVVLDSSGGGDPVFTIHEGMPIHASEELQGRLTCAPDPVDLVHHEVALIARLHVLYALQLRLSGYRVELHEQLLEVSISLVVTSCFSSCAASLKLLKLFLLDQDVGRLLLLGLTLARLLIMLSHWLDRRP